MMLRVSETFREEGLSAVVCVNTKEDSHIHGVEDQDTVVGLALSQLPRIRAAHRGTWGLFGHSMLALALGVCLRRWGTFA